MVKKNLILLLLLGTQIVLFTQKGHAFLRTISVEKKDIIEQIEFGSINWTKGIVTILGEAKVPSVTDDENKLKYESEFYVSSLAEARQKAKENSYEDARKNLYNAVLNIRLKNDYYIQSYMVHSTNNFKFYLDNFLKSNLLKKYIYQTGSIRTELKFKLFSDKGLITVFTNDIKPEPVSFYTPDSYKNYIKNIKKSTELGTNAPSQTYTSIIIDASELDLVPALFPVMYNETGIPIFTPEIVYKKAVIIQGMGRYISDISLINNYSFIDQHAFIIKALKVKDKTDLILPDLETGRFLSNISTIKFLQNCNVLIILNR
ncbi:MAG: hypothetical protein KKH98_05890 [Spirochaetes bacterium]|nr:hypothetical protein [Spirochaetota bacterium]